MSDNQSNSVAANFLQYIKNEGIVDFTSYTMDWKDGPEKLKVIFTKEAVEIQRIIS